MNTIILLAALAIVVSVCYLTMRHGHDLEEPDPYAGHAFEIPSLALALALYRRSAKTHEDAARDAEMKATR